MTEDDGARLRAHTRDVLDSDPDVVPDVAVGLHRLVSAVSAELELFVAMVTLRTSAGTEAVAATSVAGHQTLEEMQFSLGEGPGVDAFSAGRPVFASDLGSAFGRWPGYAPAAVRAGAGAAYAFPLQLGAVRFGVLTLYARDVRRLEAQEVAQCLIFADVATELLLDSSTSGSVDRPDPDLQDVLQIRVEVYQAQGMVMVQLGVSLAEALSRLRAFAYAEEHDLNELAAAIIDGTVRLSRDGPAQ